MKWWLSYIFWALKGRPLVLLYKYISWLIRGKPMITYPGFNCGCCGKYTAKPFSIRDYKSDGWLDNWGLCDKGECEYEKAD